LRSVSGERRTEFHRRRNRYEGGYNTAVFSACTNTTTNLVFDLKATDTYAGSGDSVFIEGDPFVKHTLAQYADSKSLKGYELVGWLGEVYVKLL
jgi:hypothetical protein